jgi:paired amphipathic helix protein Sin3a
MVMSVLDGNMDSMAFEDTLREMFGIYAFTAFTLDKVIANCVRQLQHLVTDESCTECWDLYLSEKRVGGTGGEVATADKRYFNELLYQKKSEKILADENCFKIVLYRDRGSMTVELLDTETESRIGSENEEEEEGKDEKQQQLEAYVARFLGPGEPMTLSPDTVSHLARKPVFCPRLVRNYRAKTRHRIVPRRNQDSAQAEVEGGELKEETNANRPGLGRHDKLNLSDSAFMWEESDNSSCVINTDYKILWVVNSEHCIYKRNANYRAKKTHPAVCVRKYKAWGAWHGAWVAQHVTEAQQTKHSEWMLGRVEGLRPNKTHRLQFSDLSKAPYRTFTKFKVGELSS